MIAFKFDAGKVLFAIASLSDHAATHSLTTDVKSRWVRENASLFRFPPAAEVADHIQRVARQFKTADQITLHVLGNSRVVAGLAHYGEATP